MNVLGVTDGRQGCLRASPGRRLELRGVRRAHDVHRPADVDYHHAHPSRDAVPRRAVWIRLDDRGDREELPREDDPQRVRSRPFARARRLREPQRRAVVPSDGPREQPPLFAVRAHQLDAAGDVRVSGADARVTRTGGAYRAGRRVLLEEHLRETRPVTSGGGHHGADQQWSLGISDFEKMCVCSKQGKTDYRHSAAAVVVAFYNILPILTTISTLSTPWRTPTSPHPRVTRTKRRRTPTHHHASDQSQSPSRRRSIASRSHPPPHP